MPLGSGNPGLPPVVPTPAAGNQTPAVATRGVNAASGIDSLTRRLLGMRCWSTGAFTGSAGQAGASFQGLFVANTNRLRIRQIIWQVSPDAAISGGAIEVVLQLRTNGIPTGLEIVLFVPVTSVQATVSANAYPFNLGDGWVGAKGSPVDVYVASTLTTGQFRVLILGNEEPAD